MKQIREQKNHLFARLALLFSFVLCAMMIFGISGKAAEQVVATKADYSVKMIDNGNTCTIVFTPAQTMDLVIAHYSVNNTDTSENVTMNPSGENFEYTVNGVNTGDTIRVWFTYESGGVGYGSEAETVSYVIGSATDNEESGNGGESEDTGNTTPEVTPAIRIEAEDYTKAYGVEKANGQISSLDTNDWMRYETNVTEAGKYQIVVSAKANATKNGKLVLRDASKRIATVEITTGGADFAEYQSAEIDLPAGNLQITAIAVAGGITADWIELRAVTGGETETPEAGGNDDDNQPTVTEPTEIAIGTKVEAETGALANGATVVDAANCSGGKRIGEIGGAKKGSASFKVNVTEAGEYEVTVAYCTVGERQLNVEVNGTTNAVNCSSTGGWDTPSATPVTAKVNLNAGWNTIVLTGVGEAYAPNVDWFEIKKAEASTNPGNGETETPGNGETIDGVEVPIFDESIPKKDDTIIFQLNNKTNGAYADNQIYWCVLGYHPQTNNLVYVDPQGNMHDAHVGLNTIQVGDRMCADIFNTLDENKYVYMPSIVSGRMYISYGSPVYITINEAADGRIGFAGPDMNNTSDPNREVYFEFMEFTIGGGAGPTEYWGNTTRVDNFCFPVVTRLIGGEGSTNGIDYENYSRTVGDIGTREQIYKEFVENAPTEFKDLAEPYRIVAPAKGSFNEGKANANYFQDYINQFWTKFANEDLKFECQGGKFTARVNGDYIYFIEERSGQIGQVLKPNTQEVLEGKGAFDSGSDIEKVFEAQLCAAFNRGVALNPEDWYTPEKYYQTLPYNYYSKFWHEHGVDGYAYGFCYDDVHEQATLLHYTNPTALVMDLKW